jgi:hypothetical protein
MSTSLSASSMLERSGKPSSSSPSEPSILSEFRGTFKKSRDDGPQVLLRLRRDHEPVAIALDGGAILSHGVWADRVQVPVHPGREVPIGAPIIREALRDPAIADWAETKNRPGRTRKRQFKHYVLISFQFHSFLADNTRTVKRLTRRREPERTASCPAIPSPTLSAGAQNQPAMGAIES